MLFGIKQGKQKLQYKYEQYTIWTLTALTLFTEYSAQYHVHDMQYTTKNYSNSQRQREEKEKKR